MADYNLHGLTPRDFQHLVQAIARKQISGGISAFGDGKDGARDLAYEGPMNYPATSAPWDGYLVVGCKFQQKPTGQPQKDGQWAQNQAETDLKKFLNRRRKLRRPRYYLFATNVAMTAVSNTGSRDRMTALLDSYQQRLGLKGFGIWDYNDIRGFLDGDADLRAAYGHLVTAGDVLHLMMSELNARRPDFSNVMRVFLQKELLADMSAKLQSAGEDPDAQIPLANVFVDLPFADSAQDALLRQNSERKLPEVVDTLLREGAFVLRRTSVEAEEPALHDQRSATRRQAKFAIVGGPGQGKSTFGQYLCQLHRAALLRDVPGNVLDDRVPRVIQQLEKAAVPNGLPLARRFPVRIELRNLAHALANESRLTLFEYIRRDIERLANASIEAHDLKRWLSLYPWLLVLDGLDEVPPSSNRASVLSEISSFQVDAASSNADILVVATTRPQSYSKELPEEAFRHLYLTPLTSGKALHYAQKLVEARYGSDVRRADELMKSLEKACENPATSRLMQSPLQVTIMATLIEDTGEPPQQRYKLFAEYYRTIYRRETRRKLLDGILSERQKDIDTIHAQAGLLLHAASESVAEQAPSHSRVEMDSALSDEQFRELVRRRLEQIRVSPAKAADLLKKISDGSLQRLVFLVRQTEGWVRFDIASFKEFMAAEAIMTGSDEDVRERMRVIAPASYWRNVFQFAVGKYFLEREHLLDTLVTLCVSLNDDRAASDALSDKTAGAAAKAARWGSQLALDILSDGTARQYPGFESVFAKIALELADQWDEETAARLAAVYHDDLKALYQDAIRSKLAASNEWRQLGALQLLAGLAERKLRWALDLLESSWPSLPDVQRMLLIKEQSHEYAEWAVRRLNDLAPLIEPYWLLRLGNVRPNSNLPRGLSPALKSLAQRSRRYPAKIRARNHTRWRFLAENLFITPTQYSGALWNAVCHLEFRHNEWAPIISSIRFSADPSAITLARELRGLAETWPHDEGRWLWDGFVPWQIEECLLRARSAADLLEFANSAEQGLLGDLKDWLTAEKQWSEEGITDDELQTVDNEEFRFPMYGTRFAFPFSSFSANFREPSSAQFSQSVERLTEIRNVYTRACFASQLWTQWQHQRRRQITLSAAQLLNLYKHGVAAPWFGRDTFLERITAIAPPVLSSEWLELFDVIGRTVIWVTSERSPGHLAQLAAHFVADPQRWRGLINILPQIVEGGVRCSIPNVILEMAARWDTRSQQSALALMLADTTLPDSKLSEIASRLLTLPYAGGVFPPIAAIKCAAAVSREQQARFSLALLEQCAAASSWSDGVAAMHARRTLTEFLTEKPSALQDSDTWKKLNLPARL